MKCWRDMDATEKFEAIDLFISNYRVELDVDKAALVLLFDGWDIDVIADRLAKIRVTGEDDNIPF